MSLAPDQVLGAQMRPTSPASGAAAPAPSLLMAGATGVLGNEMLRRLAGTQRYRAIHVLAREPVQPAFRGVDICHIPPDPPDPPDQSSGPPSASPPPHSSHWPALAADVGVVMFDPPRMFHERERALWTPSPQDLTRTAGWMRRCGVRTLALVMPHDQGRLPAALRAGLATLDEQAVAALGFEQLLIVRSARTPGARGRATLPRRVAAWMLGTLGYMVPQSERPVRALKVAHFVDESLRALRGAAQAGTGAVRGTWVASPELLARAAYAPDMATEVGQWLAGAHRHNPPHGQEQSLHRQRR